MPEPTPENLRTQKELLDKSSSINRNLGLIFISFLVYILVTVGSVTDLMLLLPDEKVKMPIIDVELPINSFFLVTPILILGLHLNLLINLYEHRKKLRKWLNANKASENGTTTGLFPFIFDFSEAQKNKGFTYYATRTLVRVSSLYLPMLLLAYIQLRYSDMHDIQTIIWHFVFFLLDTLLVFIFLPLLSAPLSDKGYLKSVKQYYYNGFLSLPFLKPFTWGLIKMFGFSSKKWSQKTKSVLQKISPKRSIFYLAQWLIFWITVFVITDNYLLTKTICDDDRYEEVSEFMTIDWSKEFFLFPTLFIEYDWGGRKRDTFHIDIWNARSNICQYFHNASGEYILLEEDSIRLIDWEEKFQNALDTSNLDTINKSLKTSWYAYRKKPKIEVKEKSLLKEKAGDQILVHYLETMTNRDSALILADLHFSKGINIQNRDLKYANLSLSLLINADLRYAKLQGADLYNAKLQGADLSGAKLQRANLSRAKLQGADLYNAKLQGVYLSDAQLQGADLSRAQLQGADLSGAKLQGANLSRAKLQGADLYNAQLQGVYLSGAQLQGADLSDAQLQGADLSRAQLQGADLSGAKLQGAYINIANLSGIIISEPEEIDSIYFNDVQMNNEDWAMLLNDSIEIPSGRRSRYIFRIANAKKSTQDNAVFKADFDGFLAFRKNMACMDEYSIENLLLLNLFKDPLIYIHNEGLLSHVLHNCPDKVSENVRYLSLYVRNPEKIQKLIQEAAEKD